MIVKAFEEFLLRDEPMIDDLREEGRLVLRDIVRWRIWKGRLPKARAGPIAITLELVSELDYAAIDSPAALLEVIIDCNVWARDTDEISGTDNGAKVNDALRKMVVQYHGRLNDEFDVQTIKREAGPREFAMRPSDASGNWIFRSLTTFMLAVPIKVPTGAN